VKSGGGGKTVAPEPVEERTSSAASFERSAATVTMPDSPSARTTERGDEEEPEDLLGPLFEGFDT